MTAAADRVADAGVPAIAVLDAWAEQAETLARRFASARDEETLAGLAPEIHSLAAAMLAADAGAGLVTRTMSALNDALTARLLRLLALRHRLPTAAWCWLAFGSEGRGEQGFVTDQDNGLVFAAADAAEARALRPLFLAWAAAANQVLAACGFPLCAGGIMAGNAECCLSVAEWRERFAGWVRTPDPQALLAASIFFDLRALHGDAALAAGLRQQIAQLTQDAEPFLRMLAENALAAEPPLGLLGGIAARDGYIDLKKFGTRLFVDAARIFGIDCGAGATVPRLRHAAACGRLPGDMAEAATAAFLYLQRIRLLSQRQALAAGAVPGNLLAPETLNAFDRQVLHEAFRQARQLQQRLKTNFRIEG